MHSRIVLLAATAAAMFAAGMAVADAVTGQWDFNGGLTATVGADGYIWTRPASGGDPIAKTSFGPAASFGLSFPDGQPGGVMSFGAYTPQEGIKLFPNIPANGGGAYVNQYTIIYDIYYPAASSNAWRALWQTNAENANDADLFVNTSNAIGIGTGGGYHGTVQPDTWHRLAFSVDLVAGRCDKFIDGVLVGSNVGGSWTLDGRFALYTDVDGLPSLIFTDDDGETKPGYCSSVQIRNYPVSAVEAAALGGVTSTNIPPTIDPGAPVGAAISGQWDFENPSNGLQATIGLPLEWFIVSNPGTCPLDLAAVTFFGSSASFGIPDLPDGPAGVMRFGAALPCQGYLLPHGAAANGGGNKVNEYTVIMDVYFTPEDYFFSGQTLPDGNSVSHAINWIALYQSAPLNDEDAMLWIQTVDTGTGEALGELGDDGQYDCTFGWAPAATWMRIVAAVDCVNATIAKYVIYPDDTVAVPNDLTVPDCGTAPVIQSGDGLDGKRALSTSASAFDDVFYAFTDNDFETHPGFVNSLQIRDYVMTPDQVIALGGPRAAGIPRPPAFCLGDADCDGDVDFFDIDPFVSRLGCPLGAPGCDVGCPWQNADVDSDGDVDFFDIDPFVARLGSACP